MNIYDIMGLTGALILAGIIIYWAIKSNQEFKSITKNH